MDEYEHALETASPAYRAASAVGRFILGRRLSGGEVVVELATEEDLARLIEASVHQSFIGGTSGSGKSSQVAFLAQVERFAL
ncbi:hypothetical protein ACFYSF_32440 [Streptomyces canus]|uniref:hypothetical protein n=1 Tax=Streptomyces canus TaxID=58343 RepID=UPI0036B15A9C